MESVGALGALTTDRALATRGVPDNVGGMPGNMGAAAAAAAAVGGRYHRRSVETMGNGTHGAWVMLIYITPATQTYRANSMTAWARGEAGGARGQGATLLNFGYGTACAALMQRGRDLVRSHVQH